MANGLKLLGITILLVLAATLTWVFWDLPHLDSLSANLATPSIRITDRYGRSLYEVLAAGGGRHTPIPLDSIPEPLKQATVATEDRNFYRNPGVDIEGILRALWINLRGGETLAGGSTITQQVARNLLLSEDEQFERTLRRKLRESWLAWRLSRKLSKDEVLALYLNQINYGGLAYGVEAAAQIYFGKSAVDLNLAESALIAGIPQAPALYNPLVDPAAARNRQRIVLEIMLNHGFISQEQFDLSAREPLVFTSDPYPIEAPHFVMLVSAQVDEIFPAETQNQLGPLVVRTTLDLDQQHLAENAVRRHLQALATSDPTGQGHNVPGGHNVNNAALVALDPKNGQILALVGSPDYFDTQNAGAINMALAPRQPGSALKPLVYASAFDPARENPFTAATMLLDVTTSFPTHEGEAYVPKNYDNQEHGPVSAREALASSLNIPAVITLDHIGLNDLFDLASDLGISTFGNPDDYDLSLALGGGEVRLLELTAAYAAFANLGVRQTPFAILEITTVDGEILYEYDPPTPVQVLDPRVTWLISDILNDNEARSIGFGPNTALKIDRPAAVKTGTTTNFHDNWTVGYTPDLVVGVWAGNASHEPMRAVSGLSGAAPIWHQFMREALTGRPETWFTRPESLVQVEVCALSGRLPSEDCPYNRREWFIQGTQPATQDTVYARVWVDALTGFLAAENTPPERRMPVLALDLPPQAHPWARAQGLTLLSDLDPGYAMDSAASWDEYPLQIISPGANTTYHLNPDLEAASQKVHIEAVSAVGLERVQFWVDGVLAAEVAAPPYEFWWPLSIGAHVLWAEGITAEGQAVRSPEVAFVVQESFPSLGVFSKISEDSPAF